MCNQRAAANDKLQTELAEVRARLALPPQDQTLEHELRKEWWLNHGYRCFPYGDDGEMQCCMHDFKREPLDQLRIFVDESRMARLKSAVEGRLALPAWQPIETAPKDGTEVLLFQERRIVAGSWNSGGAMHMPHWMGGNYKPTHWMLLPAPPSGDTLPAFVTHEPLPSFITREGHDGTAPAPDESDSHGL